MQSLVECVPNFSEGRDVGKVEAIVRALLAGPDVDLLDQEMDHDHNRSVITLVGTREQIGESALRGIAKAAELIDLNCHQGAHPRLGATDVVPFVPVSSVTLDDCVRIAEWVAEEAWRRHSIPTYLYEAAAKRPERRNLENIRRGQFEGLRNEVHTQPERRPDFGGPELHPTAGATVVGARKFLIAYNINLRTPDVSLAKAIARKIRASSGGLPCVKAMGVDLATRGLAQVSMNLTDFETTSIATVFDAVSREAEAAGVEVAASEIVGLTPQRALTDAATQSLKLEGFTPTLILENRLATVLDRHRPSAVATPSLRSMAEPFVHAVAADTPAPGGGSASALAGAMAAALGEMVCRLTLKKKSFEAHHGSVQQALTRLGALRDELMSAVDLDAASYNAVIAAMRKPRATEAERIARDEAVQAASKGAASVPLQTAKLAAELQSVIASLSEVTIPQAASDLTVATYLTRAACAGAAENVRVNLPLIHDQEWVDGATAQLSRLGLEAKADRI